VVRTVVHPPEPRRVRPWRSLWEMGLRIASVTHGPVSRQESRRMTNKPEVENSTAELQSTCQVKRRRALLRNSHPGDEIEAEFTGLDPKFHSLPVLHAALKLLEDGSVVFLSVCQHVVNDSGKLVCGSG